MLSNSLEVILSGTAMRIGRNVFFGGEAPTENEYDAMNCEEKGNEKEDRKPNDDG